MLRVMQHRFLRVVLFGLLLGVFAACTPPTAPAQPAGEEAVEGAIDPAPEAVGEPQEGGTLTFGYSQPTSYSHFMHLREYAGGEWIYAKNFAASRLIGYHRGEGYIPDLAESWELSEDGMTLTFNLVDNAFWHDGEPFTAEDVEFTWKMMSMPGLGPYNKGRDFVPYVVGMEAFIEGEADDIAGLRVVDDHTVAFDLIEPVSADVLLIPFKKVTLAPEHILNEYLDRERAENILQSDWATGEAFVGTGPFKVVEYVADQHIVYEPHEQYHRGAPLLDRLVYRSFADPQTMAAALESGEIDAAQIPPTELERFQQMPHIYLKMNEDNPSVSGTPINVRQPYLADKRVRQALLHAIDREALVDVLNAGAGQVIDTRYMEPPRFGISPDMMTYEYDPEKARALLEEAGWDPNTVLRWAVASIPENTSLYDAINGYWADVGVQAEFDIKGDDLTTPLSSPNWDFDFYMSGYPVGHPAVASDHLDALNAACDYVCTGYENERFHELLEMSRQPLPDEEMQEVIHELQELVADEAIFLIFYRAPDVYGVNERVHDLNAAYTTMDHIDWEIHKTWVEEE